MDFLHWMIIKIKEMLEEGKSKEEIIAFINERKPLDFITWWNKNNKDNFYEDKRMQITHPKKSQFIIHFLDDEKYTMHSIQSIYNFICCEEEITLPCLRNYHCKYMENGDIQVIYYEETYFD